MKKIFNLHILLAALAMLFMVSCNDTTTDGGTQDPYAVDYSANTAEQSKQDVEDAGINLVSQVDELQNEEAINVMTEMTDLFKNSNSSPMVASRFNVPLKAALTISDDSKSTIEVYNILKASTDNGIALSDSFAAQTATYTYNFTTDKFDKSENTDAIVILFPGKENDTENTAEIKISDFTTKVITEPRNDMDLPDGTIEFPTGLKATLKYNSNTLMSYSLSADYMSDGTPTLLENILTIGNFSFNQKLTNNEYKNASFDYSFKNGDDILIAFGAEASGDWTQSNIDANTYEKQDDFDTWEETDTEEIINKSNAYIQFMDLKAIGDVDIKTIVDGEQAFDDAHESDMNEFGEYSTAINKQQTDTLVELVDANAKFILVYTKDNSLIAALKPIRTENTTYDYTNYYLDFQLVFKDNSPVAISTFVNNELTGFFDALNNFIKTVNTNHQTHIDEINPN